MTRTRYHTVHPAPPGGTKVPGRRDDAILKGSFPGSPIHRGELTREFLLSQVKDAVKGFHGSAVNDGGQYFGTIKLNFGDSPNFADVVPAGAGGSGGAFIPNTASPDPTGEGFPDPALIPEPIYSQDDVARTVGYGNSTGVSDVKTSAPDKPLADVGQAIVDRAQKDLGE